MKWRERKRRHDDVHNPMGGKGKRATRPKNKSVNTHCSHWMITTGVIDRCSICGIELPKDNL